MKKEIPEKVATMLVKYNQNPEKHRKIKDGDLFNLTVSGEYYPCCIENIDPSAEGLENGRIIRIKAIMLENFSGLPQKQAMELREGPNIFAKCELISIESIL